MKLFIELHCQVLLQRGPRSKRRTPHNKRPAEGYSFTCRRTAASGPCLLQVCCFTVSALSGLLSNNCLLDPLCWGKNKDPDSQHPPICCGLFDVAALPFERLSVLFWLVGASLAFNERQWELLHNSYHVVMSWRRSAARLLIPSTFFFFFFSQASRALFVFIGAEAERSCGECRTPYLTLGNCNLSWEEGVSLGDLPLNNYSHDKAINQAPLPASLLSCFGENRWFICRDALSLTTRTFGEETRRWRSLVSRRPSRGWKSPTESDAPHVEIRPKCLKDERDPNITHRCLLKTEIVTGCEQINEICSLFKDAKESPKTKIN